MTTSYLQACIRSKGSMCTRSTSKRQRVVAVRDLEVEFFEQALVADRPANIRTQGQADYVGFFQP